MTYLPENIFKNILSYCDNRVERRQEFNHKQVLSSIKEINSNLQFLDHNCFELDNPEWVTIFNNQILEFHNNNIFSNTTAYDDDGVLSFIYYKYI